MKERFKSALAGLRGAYDKHGAPAWGQYKGLVRGNSRGALLGLGAAATYGLWSEGQNPITSSILLAPALMGVGSALQAGGGYGMMKGVGRQVARDINTTIRQPADFGIRENFLARTSPSTNFAGRAGRAIAGIEGEVPMHLQYAAISADLEGASGLGRRFTLGELAGKKDMGGFAGKYSDAASIQARINESPEFAEQFSKRASSFEGMTGIGSRAATGSAATPRYIGGTRGELVGQLRTQGQGQLASEVAGITGDVSIRGIGVEGSKNITALEYQMGGASFRAPIVGPDGVVKAGIFGQNTNVARKQIFLGSLEGMAAGGTPEVVALDVAVAKTIRTYHGRAMEKGQLGGLAGYLGDLANIPIRGLKGDRGLAGGMGRALSWTNPYRPSRTGMATSTNVAIRGLDVQLSIPARKFTGLQETMALGNFVERGQLSSQTMLTMRDRGYAMLGSETAGRSGTFVSTSKMAGLFPGSFMTPADKPARGIRDYTKPYYITGGGAMQRRPFAARGLTKAVGPSTGLAMHYNAIFESEANFLSELLNTGSKSGTLNPNVNKMIEGIMGSPMTGAQLSEMRAALSPIANMREGQFAAAIPGSAKMVTEKSALIHTLPDDIAGLAEGAILPSNRPIGFDAANLPVQHSYAKLGGGQARLLGIESRKEAGRTVHLVRWAEEQAAANVKYGSDVGKMFALEMKESQTPLVMRFINNLRRNQSLGKRLYGNSEYAPMVGGVSNAVEAFTLAGTFGKFQGGPEVLASSIAEAYMPSMSKGGQGAFRGMLRRNRMAIVGGGVQSRFRGADDIARAHEALMSFSRGMIDRPASLGLRKGLFKGVPSSMNAGAAVLMRGGIMSEALAWDALNLSVPGNVPITANQLSIMNQYGLSAGVEELLGRRKMSGDAKATEAYKLALEKFVRPGAKMPSNMPIHNLADWQTSLGPAQWRQSERVAENFLINLEVAGKEMQAGTLKKALGLSSLQIPVPGVNTDFWHASYRTPAGDMVSSEAWTGPLSRFLRSVEDVYSNRQGSPAMARRHLTSYLNEVRGMDVNLTLGRGGTVYDAGKSIAGRGMFRDYGRMYKGHSVFGGRATGFMVGINPEDYKQLAGDASYATGYSTRFPATTVDPILMIADPDVERGAMAMDETRRALMGADFDGDTFFASVMRSEGGISEAKGVIFGGSAQAAAYDEAADARALLGGVADDLTALGRASRTTGTSAFENIATKMTKRFENFMPVSLQSEGTILAKSYTRAIGTFSNIASEYIMAGNAMPGARIARAQLLRDIQQAAIDFGRKSVDKISPDELSGALRQAMKRAAQGDIDGANSIFAEVMQKLNVGVDMDANLQTLQDSYANVPSKAYGLEVLSRELQAAKAGYFEPLRGNLEAQAELGKLSEAQGLLQKRFFGGRGAADSVEEVQEALVGMQTHLGAQTTLAGQGVASIGSGSAGKQITGINQAIAKARGTKHILDDVWKVMKASPHFGTARAGVMVTGGLMAANFMFNSPSDMKPPAYEGSQRRMMQSPDVGLAGMAGAPMPGSGGGHVVRGGEMRNPRRTNRPTPPQNTIPRRYYVNQTNRVPRIRYAGSGDPYDRNEYATEVATHLQRMAGGDARINVVHDATSRRMSEHEFQDKMREDLRGGR